MADSSLPTYVERGGEIVGRPPFASSKVRMYWFVLRADDSHLGRMMARYLNEPSGGNVQFSPVAPFFVLTFAEIGQLKSEDPADADLGSYTYREAGLWTLAQDHKRGGEMLNVFLPYVFVNDGSVMANGRETYGFPKQFSHIEIGSGHSSKPGEFPDRFSIETYSLRRFRRDAVARWQNLLVVQGNGPPAVTEGPRWKHGAELAKGLGDAIVSIVGSGALIMSVERIVRTIVTRQVPMVFLKQFRDIADPTRACYQAVVEAPATFTEFRGAGLLPGEYKVAIEDLEGVPIAWEFGLDAGRSLDVVTSFWLDFGFQMETGRELWRGVTGEKPLVRMYPARG